MQIGLGAHARAARSVMLVPGRRRGVAQDTRAQLELAFTVILGMGLESVSWEPLLWVQAKCVIMKPPPSWRPVQSEIRVLGQFLVRRCLIDHSFHSLQP